jgi:hypothetical protein
VCSAAVSTPEIAAGDGKAGNAVESDAAGVTGPTVELAVGETALTLAVGCVPDDDPDTFAVESVELVVCADTEESATDWTVPALACFEPVLAPPVPTTRPDPAAVRFDVPVVADGPFDPVPDGSEDAFAELEFAPAPDDPVDPSAQATPYPVENNAAPTPRATANPPTRPTNLEAPMTF